MRRLHKYFLVEEHDFVEKKVKFQTQKKLLWKPHQIKITLEHS